MSLLGPGFDLHNVKHTNPSSSVADSSLCRDQWSSFYQMSRWRYNIQAQIIENLVFCCRTEEKELIVEHSTFIAFGFREKLYTGFFVACAVNFNSNLCNSFQTDVKSLPYKCKLRILLPTKNCIHVSNVDEIRHTKLLYL